MNRGYVKLWRKSKDSGFLGNAEAWQLLSWCLINATHKPHKQLVGKQLVELQPGQVVFGRVSVARELNTTERKVRTSLELLKKAEFLTIKTTSKYSILTIVNWHTYQEERPAEDQQNDQHHSHQATSKRPANDHKQEYKNKEQEKNINTPPTPPLGGDEDAPLDSPIPKGKKRQPTGNSAPELRAVVEAYTSSEALRQTLEDFRQMRERKRTPMTGRALRLILEKLDSLSGGDEAVKIAILEQSIVNSWQNIFELKASGNSRASPGNGYMSPSQRRVEENIEAGRIAKEMLFGKKENNHAGA